MVSEIVLRFLETMTSRHTSILTRYFNASATLSAGGGSKHFLINVVGFDITLFFDERSERASSRQDATSNCGLSNFSIWLLKKFSCTRRNTLPLQVLPVLPRLWSQIA